VYVLIGILIGFVAAIPLGPVNVYVISQAMKRDFLHGFMAGLTAAVLDFIYCLVAVLGLTQVTALMKRWLVVLKIVAALFLLLIAVRLFLQSREKKKAVLTKETTTFTARPMLAVLALYIPNPSIYFFWIGVAAWVASHGWVGYSTLTDIVFALSCGTGGALWYLILTRYVSKYHHQFSAKTFRTIFLVLAIILFASAAYTFLSIFVHF